jgi:hypothetical protein
MSVDAELRGDGCTLGLRVAGYEARDIRSGEDANWLTAEVELTVGLYGSYRARQRCSLYTPDLAAFASQLRVLNTDLTGQAELGHLEDEIRATVTLVSGKGRLWGYVREHVGAKLTFDEIPVDQTHVGQALTQFNALLAAFPVR